MRLQLLLGSLAAAAVLPAPVLAAQNQAPLPAPATDPVRQRAEALAKEASERFSQVLRESRVAQATSPAKKGEDPWAPALRWLQHAQDEYGKLVTELKQGPDGLPPRKPAAAPAPKSAQPAAPAPASPRRR